jgi:hypothetical protein
LADASLTLTRKYIVFNEARKLEVLQGLLSGYTPLHGDTPLPLNVVTAVGKNMVVKHWLEVRKPRAKPKAATDGMSGAHIQEVSDEEDVDDTSALEKGAGSAAATADWLKNADEVLRHATVAGTDAALSVGVLAGELASRVAEAREEASARVEEAKEAASVSHGQAMAGVAFLQGQVSTMAKEVNQVSFRLLNAMHHTVHMRHWGRSGTLLDTLLDTHGCGHDYAGICRVCPVIWAYSTLKCHNFC